MSTRNNAEHAYFARVPTALLADLTSPRSPIFAFAESDGPLHVNPAALRARAAHQRVSGEAAGTGAVPPMAFRPTARPAAPRPLATSSRRGA